MKNNIACCSECSEEMITFWRTEEKLRHEKCPSMYSTDFVSGFWYGARSYREGRINDELKIIKKKTGINE